MALGVTSYSSGRPPRFRRRESPAPTAAALPVGWERIAGIAGLVWPWCRLPLSLLAVAHLALALLFPAGRNALFGVTAREGVAYQTLFPVGDALGFYATRGRDGFLVYKVYPQDGGVVEGTFPDIDVAPRLRYDRWSVAGHVASGSYPELHALVTRYVVDRLPSAPIRLELYAARWVWNRDELRFPWPGTDPQPALQLDLLGTYNGFTRVWSPRPGEGKAR
jgi:hypothetical protein